MMNNRPALSGFSRKTLALYFFMGVTLLLVSEYGRTIVSREDRSVIQTADVKGGSANASDIGARARRGWYESPVNIAFAILNTLGVAVIITAAFSFVSSSEEFLAAVGRVLRDIVLDRAYFDRLTETEKHAIVKRLLSSGENTSLEADHFRPFLDHISNEVMNTAKGCIRKNYKISESASLEEVHGEKRVVTRSTITYRLFPSSRGFEPIKVLFDGETNESLCEYVSIKTSVGDKATYGPKELEKARKESLSPNDIEIDVSALYGRCQYLDISIRSREVGKDHWIMGGFISLQPTLDWTYSLHCASNVKIREFHIYSEKDSFDIHEDSEEKLFIEYRDWIEVGRGLVVLMGVDGVPPVASAPVSAKRRRLSKRS